MSDTNHIAEAVIQSLREKPTLNTPTLIAGGGIVPDHVERPEIEKALAALVSEGKVKHRATGWKLAPGVA